MGFILGIPVFMITIFVVVWFCMSNKYSRPSMLVALGCFVVGLFIPIMIIPAVLAGMFSFAVRIAKS